MIVDIDAVEGHIGLVGPPSVDGTVAIIRGGCVERRHARLEAQQPHHIAKVER